MAETLTIRGGEAHGGSFLRRVAVPLFLAVALILGGCSSMSDTEKRTASGVGIGAAVGAAGGALFGAIAGVPGTGAAIGAAAGAALGGAGGYIYDQHKKRKESEAEAGRLRSENEELRSKAAEQ